MFWDADNSNENSQVHYIHDRFPDQFEQSTAIFFMFQLHQEMNYLILTLIISEAFCGLTAVFLACDFGQRVSDKWKEINSKIDQFDWYSYPNELKRILPTIIAIAQQPIELECFGSFTLSREVFRKVSPSNRHVKVKIVWLHQR